MIPDLPGTIPLFPLPGALLLPRARLPLHIFEPRYLAMVDDCLKTPERLIGMIQPSEMPAGQDIGLAPLSAIGCAGRLTAFTETDDRRYLVTLTGVSRFRIMAEIDSFAPWRRAQVDWTPFARDPGPAEKDTDFDRTGFLALLARYFDRQDMSAEWDSLREAEPEVLVNALSMMCPFSPGEKQALLEASTLVGRRETLATLMEMAARGSAADGEKVLQ